MFVICCISPGPLHDIQPPAVFLFRILTLLLYIFGLDIFLILCSDTFGISPVIFVYILSHL
jgi:hypothetical protein